MDETHENKVTHKVKEMKLFEEKDQNPNKKSIGKLTKQGKK